MKKIKSTTASVSVLFSVSTLVPEGGIRRQYSPSGDEFYEWLGPEGR